MVLDRALLKKLLGSDALGSLFHSPEIPRFTTKINEIILGTYKI